MNATRLMYNDALQQTESRELLLNLVRMRYLESPEFLGVSSISTQYNFDASVSVGGTLGISEGEPTRLAEPGARAGFSERPTITFVPRRDPEFAKQLLAPLDLEMLVYLTDYGWAMDRILRVTVATLNDLKNGPSREFSDADEARELSRFSQAAKTLAALRQKGFLHLNLEERLKKQSGPLSEDKIDSGDFLAAEREGYRLQYFAEDQAYFITRTDRVLVLSFKEESLNDPQVSAIPEILNVPAGQTQFTLQTRKDSGQKDAITIRMRSILGVFAYLSRGIDVPDSHFRLVGTEENVEKIKAGAEVFQDLFRVRVQPSQPERALVAVPFRGHWYYIDEEDLATKRTLGLLSYLVKLKINAGGVENLPVLTLPVGQ